MSPAVLIRPLALASLLALAGPVAHAAELYGGIGLPGLMLGVAQPVGEQFALRADLATLGDHSGHEDRDGIRYNAQVKTRRLGLFGDWFPFSGSGWRMTAGLSLSQYKLDLDAAGAGQTITVGDNSYVLSAADGLAMQIRFPETMPYLGLGWGHHAASGWRMAVDLGAMLGKAKVTATPRGQLASDVAQADVDKELAQLRDSLGRYKAIPQLSLTLGYSF
jgi:hypothetical protein